MEVRAIRRTVPAGRIFFPDRARILLPLCSLFIRDGRSARFVEALDHGAHELDQGKCAQCLSDYIRPGNRLLPDFVLLMPA